MAESDDIQEVIGRIYSIRNENSDTLLEVSFFLREIDTKLHRDIIYVQLSDGGHNFSKDDMVKIQYVLKSYDYKIKGIKKYEKTVAEEIEQEERGIKDEQAFIPVHKHLRA